MNTLILMGSPRKQGNTIVLVKAFQEYLSQNQVSHELLWLYDLDITSCVACRACQQDWSVFGCPLADDVHSIFSKVLAAELIILATPIYSWYCTGPMKALLDRLMYGMNKFYGEERGPSLWAGKNLALVVTCGYGLDKGPDLFLQGMQRYCKHSSLNFKGMLAERDFGYKTIFADDGKATRAREFAQRLAVGLH